MIFVILEVVKNTSSLLPLFNLPILPQILQKSKRDPILKREIPFLLLDRSQLIILSIQKAVTPCCNDP